MATRIIKWNGDKVFNATRDDMKKRVGQAVEFLRGEAIKSINTSQPKARAASGARRGLDPSKPGDPPKRVEGDLVRSIVTEVKAGVILRNRVTGRYGSTQTKKAKSLELGTSKMAARPFLRPALLNNTARVLEILGK